MSIGVTDEEEGQAVLTENSKEVVNINLLEKWKARGNLNVQKGYFALAERYYSRGLSRIPQETHLSEELKGLEIMLLCNRALCHIKLENYGAAVADATAAILASQNASAKAFFRRGTAHMCLTKYENAVADFRKATKLAPDDKSGLLRLKEAQQLLRQQRFAEAIRVESALPPSATIDPNAFPIPENYTGPVFESRQDLSPILFEKILTYFLSDPKNRLATRIIMSLALEIIKDNEQLPNIVPVNVADDEMITVCGDVHGQFHDLAHIFDEFGYPSDTNKYLFNGDFVDRGAFSVEVITTLYLARLIWPKSFFLTRGNHESKSMTRLYGFESEMKTKGSQTLYDLYIESFDGLPLAHTINDRIFVVHGGLSSKPVTLAEINQLDRRSEEDEGLITDLLWSDPQPADGFSPSKRGVSNTFGPDITKKFLDLNNLELVIRSHEMKELGYDIEHNGHMITVFSAPNYCDVMGNKGAVIQFDGRSLNNRLVPLKPDCKMFSSVPHPKVLTPNRFAFMNQ